ncbi:MAG TPA: hypothetical protein VIQ03_06925 [Gammaproteobacteria bacterium]
MRTIGLFIKLVFSLGILIIIAAVAFMIMAMQDYPSVSKNTPLSPDEISQVKKLIQNNDPTRFSKKQKRQLQINENDLNLLLRYLSDKTDDQIRAKTIILPSILYLQTSITLQNNPFGEFLNIAAELEQIDQKLKIKSMDIGEVSVPAFIANALVDHLHTHLQDNYMEYQATIQSVDNFQLQQHVLSVNYHWQPELANQIKDQLSSRLITKEQKEIFLAYHQQLAIVINNIRDTRPSLTLLLNEMFQFAKQRSLLSDPIMENRAMLITLGAYMLNKNIPELIGMASTKNIKRKNFYLLNRNDLSKHLVISSALTAMADSAFAHAIGLDKELSDSDGGSGFSFADLTADRAGVTLATTALSSENNARVMQLRLASVSLESDYMPDINQMPEGIQKLDFSLAYRNTESPEYKLIITEIDQRIANCSIYQ